MAEKRAELRLQAAAFRPEAHLAALPLLAEAAACLRDAGDEAGRQRLERAHHIERARVETRYRLLQLRLERALSTGDRRLAATTARALRALVGEGSPKYAARLAHIAQMEFE